MNKQQIKDLIFGEHRVRAFAILALVVVMIVLYCYQHYGTSQPLPLATTQFHYPLTHSITLPSVPN